MGGLNDRYDRMMNSVKNQALGTPTPASRKRHQRDEPDVSASLSRPKNVAQGFTVIRPTGSSKDEAEEVDGIAEVSPSLIPAAILLI